MGYKEDYEDYEKEQYEKKEEQVKKQILADYYNSLLGKDAYIEYNNTLAEIKSEFPHDCCILDVNYIEKFSNKNNLKNGVDYKRFDNRVFFPSEHMQDTFEKFQNTQRWIERSIDHAPSSIEHNYSKIIFIKTNKLEASINIIPKFEKFYDVMETVIDFYLLNKYELPAKAEDFMQNLFLIDTRNKYFTILVKDDTDAASLIARLSDIAEVVE